MLKVLLGVLLGIGASCAHAAEMQWHVDYEEAKILSHEQEKPLILFFTGSDWSGWGMKMKKEILETSEFQEKIGEACICVEIDFPLYTHLPSWKIEQNGQLKEKMEVKKYPCLVLLDPQERELARLGYLPLSGEKYAELLLQFIKENDHLSELMTHLATVAAAELEENYRKACELGRHEDAEKILEVGGKSGEPTFFLIEQYRIASEAHSSECAELWEKLMALEGVDAKHIHYSLALIDFQRLASKAGCKSSSEEAIRPLQDYLTRYGKEDEQHAWRMEMLISQFYLDRDEWKEALEHARSAYKTAPEVMHDEIARSLRYIESQTDEVAAN